MRSQSLLIALGALVCLTGCTEDMEPTSSRDVFGGRLTLKPRGLAYEHTDSVILTVDGASYQLTHITHYTDLCDSRGTVNDFGRNYCSFQPTYVITQDCDTMRVPRNNYTAVFRGDSLIMTQLADSNVFEITYTFRLKSHK
jgi:hypothetical protein